MDLAAGVYFRTLLEPLPGTTGLGPLPLGPANLCHGRPAQAGRPSWRIQLQASHGKPVSVARGFRSSKADDSLMVWSQAGYRNDAWSWAAVSASRGSWKEMYRHTWAIGGVMRSAHAVPAAGRCPAPRPGDCAAARGPPSGRPSPAVSAGHHGLHPRLLRSVSPCAHYADAAATVRRHTGRLLGGHGCFLLPGLAPGRRVASPSARPGLSAQAGLPSPPSWPPRHDGAGRTDVGSRRGPGSCGSGPPRRR